MGDHSFVLGVRKLTAPRPAQHRTNLLKRHVVCTAWTPARWYFRLRAARTSSNLLTSPVAAQPPTAAASGTEAEAAERLRQTVALIKTADQLAPYDRTTFNVALLLWRSIANLPEAQRRCLLDELNARDIRLLWRLSGQRFFAPAKDVATTQAGWSLANDLPAEAGQVIQYDGKAALPLNVFGISRFSKLFALLPTSQQLFGRVSVRKGPPGHLLYPLYFSLQPSQAVVIATEEVADLRLEYWEEQPEMLSAPPTNMAAGVWPSYRKPLPPFTGALVDYVRAVGPGVYVGVGWKEAGYPKRLPTRFLPFLMVKSSTSS